MAADWHIVTFPLILPWREEFWTLPLYFPRLQVGVAQGWPAQLPYQGIPLPPEAQVKPHELKHYQPGDLRQWQAFGDYRAARGEGEDVLRQIRDYGRLQVPEKDASVEAWALAWQLEKLQADQEAQLLMVDQGQDWLKDILTPEPWEDRPSFGPVPGVQEMVDPDLARLRYRLWERVMVAQLQHPWTPFLLGRTSRSLLLTLKGWPEWTGLKKVQLSLPGCRSAEEWRKVCGSGAAPPWREEAGELVTELLEAAADPEALAAAAQKFNDFLVHTVMANWPFPVIWPFDLEVWAPDSENEEPVLCWAGAGAGILPG